MKSRLPTHEWLIIGLLVSSLLILALVAWTGKKDRLPLVLAPQEISLQDIQVTVQGAVARPGSYELKRGNKLKDLWERCEPLPDADLSQFKPNSLLRDGQVVKVPLKEYVTVFIEGAVAQPKSLKILKGTQMKELLSLLEFLPEADKAKLNKTRRLKDQEIIHIPVKKPRKPRISKRTNQKEKIVTE